MIKPCPTTAAQLNVYNSADLGNRRLTIAGRTRPIDELTHQILLEWLDHRRTRWPNTANPHLIPVDRTTGRHAGPVRELAAW